MVLTETQAKLFYDLWVPLLDFVNQKYRLRKEFYGMDSPRGLPLDVVRMISEKLWKIYSRKTSLIPFQDVIIYDGVVMPYGICLGKNMADEVRQIYKNAKQQKRIIERM